MVAGAASEDSAPSFRPPRSPSSPSFSPRLDADDGLALRDEVERVGVLVALSHDDLARLESPLRERRRDPRALLRGEPGERRDGVQEQLALQALLNRYLPRHLAEGLALQDPHDASLRGGDDGRRSRGLEHERDLAEDVAAGFGVHLDVDAVALALDVEGALLDEEELGAEVVLDDEPLVQRHLRARHRARDAVAHRGVELMKQHRVLQGILDEHELLLRGLAPARVLAQRPRGTRAGVSEALGHALLAQTPERAPGSLGVVARGGRRTVRGGTRARTARGGRRVLTPGRSIARSRGEAPHARPGRASEIARPPGSRARRCARRVGRGTRDDPAAERFRYVDIFSETTTPGSFDPLKSRDGTFRPSTDRRTIRRQRFGARSGIC